MSSDFGTKRVAIYARVSTDDKGQDPKNQIDEIHAYCAREGLEIAPEREYVDRETGTGKRRRSEFERMLADAERHRFDLLLIWSLDRLTREGTLRTLLLVDQLDRCKVRVKSLREPWLDPDSPTYELLLPIFAWIARQESRRISERVKAGLARRRREGFVLGAPEKRDYSKIGELKNEGRSVGEIARELGMPKSTVRFHLKKLRRSV